MNSVERVKAICKERKIPISKIERDLGYANSAKVLSVFSGGTVQQITNSLLVDLLKSNLMIIRQNDRIIKLLEER